MRDVKERPKPQSVQDEEDLKMMRRIKEVVRGGDDVEVRQAPGGGIKILTVRKNIISTTE